MKTNISFREAQLMVIGAESLQNRHPKFVTLNNLQKFNIGDCIEVVEISLDSDSIVIRVAEGPESYINVYNLSETIINECIRILREVANYVDGEETTNKSK